MRGLIYGWIDAAKDMDVRERPIERTKAPAATEQRILFPPFLCCATEKGRNLPGFLKARICRAFSKPKFTRLFKAV